MKMKVKGKSGMNGAMISLNLFKMNRLSIRSPQTAVGILDPHFIAKKIAVSV